MSTINGVFRTMLTAGLVVAAGCASTGPRIAQPPAPAADASCRVGRTRGDIAAAQLASGDLVLVAEGMQISRSIDGGRSFAVTPGPLDCRWPGVDVVGDRLYVACVEVDVESRLLFTLSDDGGMSFAPPIALAASQHSLIDAELVALSDERLLVLVSEVSGPPNRNAARYTVRSFGSRDGGASWAEIGAVVEGLFGVNIEDTRALWLGGDEILLAYEYEVREGGLSAIRQLRSRNGGASWEEETALWVGGPPSDLEPGGYLDLGDGELWFVASTDEEAGGGSYDRATIRRIVSKDRGHSWSAPETLVGEENQISFGAVELATGEIALPSLRFYRRARDRALYLYVVDRDTPGTYRCVTTPPR